MSNEDLMLRLLEELREDQKDMKNDIIAIKLQQAEHDRVVKLHEQRSTKLEEVITPIKDHIKLLNLLMKIVLGLGSIATAVTAILQLAR